MTPPILPPTTTLSLCFMAVEVFVKLWRGAARMGRVRAGGGFYSAAEVFTCVHTSKKVSSERKQRSGKTNRGECRVREGEGVAPQIKKGQTEVTP